MFKFKFKFKLLSLATSSHLSTSMHTLYRNIIALDLPRPYSNIKNVRMINQNLLPIFTPLR